MSERILRALMQLFAIIAKVDEVSSDKDQVHIRSYKARSIIEGLLRSELSSSDIEKYLAVFEEFLNETRAKLFRKDSDRKRTALHSVRVLLICDQINKELTQRQKVIVLLRLIEFIHTDTFYSEKELEFVKTVSDSFNIQEKEFDQIKSFTDSRFDEIIDEENHIYCKNTPIPGLINSKSEVVEGLDSLIHFIYVKSVKALFFRYYGIEELFINGQLSSADSIHLFHAGSTLRTSKSHQLFYSDLLSHVIETKGIEPLSYELKEIEHQFKSGTYAIRPINFATNNGNLIGLMGGSGTGKTTLLNIMNGKVAPSMGQVVVNGIDLHKHPERFHGIIGNVNQDDLLIEELTVFENLFFSAKLTLKGHTNAQLTKKVISVLKSVGLFEISRLKVGSVLEQIISGGQRKRLNIALELIREPAILFVDEPTSGLSSKDSENIMDLLKELALKGKLVFAVIHQPSSNIFKLFDRLVILDKGGYPIYDGIPLNAVVHFKTYSYMGNAYERECSLCGNVNPEQIFNLIDAKIVDEFGVESNQRKKSPEDWNKLYNELRPENHITKTNVKPLNTSPLPGRLVQFMTYFKRDLLSKIANKQYLVVNGVVAPSLAWFLSFFIKYFGEGNNNNNGYSYYYNENIPQFIFMTVIVAIFLGLTVSAEEINKDKKFLSREKFIRLSRGSYLIAKTLILFLISAIQSLLFVFIANFMLDIRDFWLEYWLIFFSTSCLSNLMGLNISSAFNSAKVIYIIVPLLIIPQLLFSGAIVKFDKLHPSLTKANQVPWVGNIMVSRWSYEALIVDQSTNNRYEKEFFKYRRESKSAAWKKDYWIPELKNEMTLLRNSKNLRNTEAKAAVELLKNEMKKEESHWKNLKCTDCFGFEQKGVFSEKDKEKIDNFLYNIQIASIDKMNKNDEEIQRVISTIGSDKLIRLREKYANEALTNLVTNKLERKKVIRYNNQLYRNDTPIYHESKNTPFFKTHFLAPKKYIFGKKVSTFWINVTVIWFISLITYIVLYFDLMKKFVDQAQRLTSKIINNKRQARS